LVVAVVVALREDGVDANVEDGDERHNTKLFQLE
jgi:hypothetical protein